MYGYNNLQDPYGGQQNTFQPPSNQIVFDYKKAREAGLDDTQIFQHLSEQKAKGVNIVVDKNDISSYHDAPIQEDKPNYNVFKPASPDASFGEKAVRGVGNFITNVAGKFGGFLQNNFANPLFDAGVGAASAIPTTINPNLANKEGMVENKFTGNEVKPWFSGENGQPQSFGQGVGEILQHGAEIAPWLMGGGEAKVLANVGETAINISKLRKAALIAKASVPLATGIGASGGIRETGNQMQTGDYNVPKVLGTAAEEALYGLGGEILFRGGASLLGQKASKGIASSEISNNVRDAVDKALKPSLSKVETPAMRSAYYQNANTVFETIHNLKPEFRDINGEIITGRNPQTLYEMSQAFPNAKQTIFNEYDNIARQSGQQGAQFNPQSIIDKLNAYAQDVSHSPEIRAYAEKKAQSLAELQGASPQVIQSRIAELNKGLDGLQLGTERPRLEVDASIAEQLRTNLDQLIEQTTGESYAPLKKLYGSFSAIEKDLNRAVNNYLRKSGSGLPGITDIFTGGDITAGILTANPALVAKGVAGKGIREFITWFTNPNRYIKKAFQSFEGVAEKSIRVKPIAPITDKSRLLEAPKSIRLNAPKSKSGLLSQAEAQAKLDGYKKPSGIKVKAPVKSKAETAVVSKPKVVVKENPLFAEARKYNSADEATSINRTKLTSPGTIEDAGQMKEAVKTKENAEKLKESYLDQLIQAQQDIKAEGGRQTASTNALLRERDAKTALKTLEKIESELPTKSQLTDIYNQAKGVSKESGKLNWDTIPEGGIKTTIPLDKIRVNSDALEKATNNVKRGDGSRTSGLIDVAMLKDGTFAISEGHHRAVQKLLQGGKDIEALVHSTKHSASPDSIYKGLDTTFAKGVKEAPASKKIKVRKQK